jgi:site-specific DNA recombinase
MRGSELRAVAYLRFSTDKQKDASIEDQLRNCRIFAERQGWTIAHVFEDRGISGTITDRPGYQALLAAARSGQLDVLLCDDLSRISRDRVEFSRLLRELRSRGITVIGVSDGFNSTDESADVQEGVRGIINSVFIKDLAKKTHRGLMGRALKGENTGGKTFGYRTVVEEDPVRKDADGRPLIIARRLEVDEEQRPWVVQIFSWFADGLTTRDIAKRLNKAGVKTARGGTWSHTALYSPEKGGGFLDNPLYRGLRVWNRATFRKVYHDPKNPDRFKLVRQEKPESEWTRKQDESLRIIDEGLWLRVKARQKQKFEAGRNIRAALKKCVPRAKHLFSGLLKCSECDGNYVAISNGQFACSNHRDHRGCSNGMRVKRRLLEERLLYTLRHDLFTAEHLGEYAERTRRLVEDQRRARRHEEMARRTRLIELDKQIENLVKAFTDGLATRTTKERLEALEAERSALEARPEEPSIEAAIEQLPTLIERFRRKLAGAESYGDDDVPVMRELISEVIGGVVTLSPTNRGYLTASVRGHWIGLWKIWTTIDEATWSNVGGPIAGFGFLSLSKAVVAGRGFEPLTFRL